MKHRGHGIMKKFALAYSGGLDTSFCIPYLREQGFSVFTVTADTGGFSESELASIGARAKELGAIEHRVVDLRESLYRRFVSYVIKGNILRGQVYPLCVGVERGIQAEALVQFAHEIGADTVAHGCTGAGNDQVRFDVSIRSIDGRLKVIAPIRELALSREEELARLKAWGIDFPATKKKYSINQGILGTTIGGGETHDAWSDIPEEAWVNTASPAKAPEQFEDIVLRFERGELVALNASPCSGFGALVELNSRAGRHGVGRGIHIGDTVLGIKGRIAFEAPGAVTAIAAHRELEKLVLTKWQAAVKDQASATYGMLLHEGQYFNPVMRDIEALLDSSQVLVTGEARVRWHKGQLSVQGVRSPHSLMDARATYGEGAKLWNGAQAEGFCLLNGVQSMLAGARMAAR